MSEQPMMEEMANPRNRAIAYLEMKQSGKFQGGREKNIKARALPEKVRKAAPLVDTVEAFENMIDRMGAKGYEGSQKALADLRPVAYEAAQAAQMGAKIADIVLFWGTTFLVRPIIPKALGMFVAARYRPVEWALGKAAKAGAFVASSEAVAPVVNKILGGGERIKPGEPAPVAA